MRDRQNTEGVEFVRSREFLYLVYSCLENILKNILLNNPDKNKVFHVGQGPGFQRGCLAPVRISLIIIIFILPGLLKGEETNKFIEKFSLTSTATLSTNSYEWNSRDHRASTTLSATPGFQITKDLSSGVTFSTRKVVDEYENWQWANDLSVFFSYDWGKINKRLTTETTIENIFPTTSYSRKYSLLQYGVGVYQSFNFKINNWLSTTYAVGMQKNFNEVEVAYDGSSNEEWQNSHSIALNFKLTKKLKMSAAVSRAFGWTYGGSRNDYLTLAQSLGYSFSDQLAFKLGHTRGGDFLRADGKTQNFDLYDSDRSIFYTGLTINL